MLSVPVRLVVSVILLADIGGMLYALRRKLPRLCFQVSLLQTKIEDPIRSPGGLGTVHALATMMLLSTGRDVE